MRQTLCLNMTKSSHFEQSRHSLFHLKQYPFVQRNVESSDYSVKYISHLY